ncbi:MAG: nucleoside deaminase [Bacteroidetes bacterium]|nr:MAG: nucleoside deaminase [Bacteroidota bacterium]
MENLFLNDEYFMKEAIKEAKKALEKDEVPVGAIIVSSGRIIARAHNLTETLIDVTAHAEMQAMTSAENFLSGKYLNECTLYVTLEPCIMCAGALNWSQLGTLVFGSHDEKKGYKKLQKNILHKKTKVKEGILEEECGNLLKVFFKKKRRSRVNKNINFEL